MKKLLELAAKAMGIELSNHEWIDNEPRDGEYRTGFYDSLNERAWNPADNQADSDNMACDLCISTEIGFVLVVCSCEDIEIRVAHDNTIEGRRAAVRRARLLVAAVIGRAK